MRPEPRSVVSGSAADPVLNKLVEELVDKLQAGKTVDREAYRIRYPEQAEKLEKLLPAIEIMAALGLSINSPAPTGGVSDSDSTRDKTGPHRVLGDFRLLREIGRGGMAIVYEAEQISLRRRVALKVLPHTAARDPRQRDRFQVEARAAALLQHPHIVPVHAVGFEGDEPYYAMQLIHGPTLAAVIRALCRRHAKASDDSEAEAHGETALVDVQVVSGIVDDLVSNSSPLVGEVPPQAAVGGSCERPMPQSWRQRIASRFKRTIHPSFASRSHGIYRAAAGLALQAAEALDHAHRSGVVHRDIKPANLLLDRTGHLWVADFGLARMQQDSDLTKTGDLLGTLRYMSPEQAMGKRVVIDHRTDIYSLGVTLYELLTLNPAISGHDRQEVLHQIANEEPQPPRRIDPAIPRDLETIVLKMIAKEPAGRFGAAAEVAADLKRFLDGRLILARPERLAERTRSWVRRNKTKSAGVVLVTLGLIGIASYALLFELKRREAAEALARLAQSQRDATRARLDVVQVERDAARNAEKEQRLRNLLLSMEQVRTSLHRIGWREEIVRLAGQAAAIRPDPEIRDQVFAAFRGLDAREIVNREGLGSQALAFGHEGRRLLMGGLNPGKGADRRGRVWDLASGEVQYSEQVGAGPVAFDRDGTPLQLVFEPPDSLLLWDIARNRARNRFKLPDGDPPSRIALAEDGSRVAAAVSTNVIVWDASSARVIREFAGPATALTFTPDQSLLASGDSDGRVVVRSLLTGATVAAVRYRTARILCLRFARDYRRNHHGTSGWLLAAGGTGGSLVVWDLERQQPRCILPGTRFEVFAVAFNPDHTILASAGRGQSRLWDIAHGDCLLDLPGGAFHHAIALSPDGKRLATSTIKMFWPETTFIRDLEDGRDFRTLRGLDVPLGGLLIASTGRLVVGLTHDFQVAVWNLTSGRLRYVREAPEGFLTMGAAIALSPDESRLALCGGSEAQLWDLETGETLQKWSLPPGTLDLMDYDSSGRSLLVARVERRSGSKEPYFNRDPADPNVLVLRNLLGSEPEHPLREVEVFPEGHFGLSLPGFRAIVLFGTESDGQGARLLVQAYDGPTGKKSWTCRLPLSASDSHPRLSLDPSGSVLGIAFDNEPGTILISTLSGERVATLETAATALGQNPDRPGGFYTTRPGGSNRGFTLLRTDSGPVVNLGIDNSDPRNVTFHPDGRHLLWSSQDGTVTVCDLQEIRDNKQSSFPVTLRPEEGARESREKSVP